MTKVSKYLGTLFMTVLMSGEQTEEFILQRVIC